MSTYIRERSGIIKAILSSVMHSSNSTRFNLLSIRDSKYNTVIFIQLGEYGRVCRVHIDTDLSGLSVWVDYQRGDQNDLMKEVLIKDTSDELGLYRLIASLR